MELTSLQTSLTRTSDKQLLLLKASDSSQQSSPTFKLDEVTNKYKIENVEIKLLG